MEAYTPIKGKCRWWREQANEEDRHDTTIPQERKRVMCMCWIEGDVWYVTNATVPAECPNRYHCRYYVKSA